MEYTCKAERVAIYLNGRYRTAAQVKAETGCDAVINGGLYDMTTFKPVCHLRADGQTMSSDEYSYWGYGWDSGSGELELTQKPEERDNYICCVCLLKDGEAQELYYGSALGGARPRTAIGTFPDGRIWLHAERNIMRTPEQLRSYALGLGLRDAVMLDGGGSTQGIFPEGSVTAERRVQNLICVWERKEKDMDKPDWWKVRYITENDGYRRNGALTPKGIVLHSTAMPGYDAEAIFRNFNRTGRGASIHGCIDDKEFIQTMPFARKAGHVGRGSRGTLNDTHIGIELCEPTGLTYNSAGSVITKYAPPEGYFKAVWEKAVYVFAALCREYGLDPGKDGVILSHAEAHARGYGDNHADTGHWFRWENVTMDDFRRAVADRMSETEDEEEMSYEKFCEYMDRYMSEADDSAAPVWAAESAQKAVDKGIIKGDGNGAYNWNKPLTRAAYVVTQDRQGLI